MYLKDNESSLNGSVLPSPNSKNLSKSIGYYDSHPIGSPKRKELLLGSNLNTTEIHYMHTN